MKKIIWIFTLTALLFCGCASEESLENRKDILIKENHSLWKQNDNLKKENKNAVNQLKEINEELKELNIFKSGNTPVYLLTLELKQSHFSLSIKKHIKDAMNKVTFTIPVSKEFYDSQKVDSMLVDKFRAGSFWTGGSVGSWEVKVTDKKIK
jgi:hypothetical protein